MEEIIEALQEEKQRVTNAIAILRYGRPIDRKKRRMSAAARRRISRGQELRWAKLRKKKENEAADLHGDGMSAISGNSQ